MGNVFKIQSVATDKVLDVPGGQLGNGVVIQQWDDLGGTNQKWEMRLIGVAFGKDVYTIASLASKLVLDVPNGDLSDQVKIQQFASNGGTNQMWYKIAVGDGSYKIESVSSQKVLDVPAAAPDNGVQIQQFHDNGGANQHWRFIEVSPE